MEPTRLFLLTQPVSQEEAQAAFKESGVDVSQDALAPMGSNACYTTVIDATKYIFSGAKDDAEGNTLGDYVLVHQHSHDETNTLIFGAAHTWQWIDDVAKYRFVQKGDVMEIPAGTPHCMVASKANDQWGFIIARSSIHNPQEFPKSLPKFKLLDEAIGRYL